MYLKDGLLQETLFDKTTRQSEGSTWMIEGRMSNLKTIGWWG